MMRLRIRGLSAVAGSVVLLASYASAQTHYSIRRLTCVGLDHGVAWDIDNHGNVVGEMLDASGVSRPVVWRQAIGEALAVLPGGNRGVAYTISSEGSSEGIIGGSSAASNSSASAAIWVLADSTRVGVDLGTGPNGFGAAVLGIHQNTGVGYLDDGITGSPAVWLNITGKSSLLQLPLPQGTIAGEAVGLTGLDFIVGHAATWSTSKPVVWDISGATPTVTELPTLGNWGRIVDVNRHRLAIGSSISAATGYMHLASWQDGAIRDHGHLPGMDCFGESVNEFGDIVGWARTNSTPPYTAIVKLTGSAIVDLNDLLPPQSGWSAVRAHGINDAGYIVGSGVFGGYYEPFLLVPTKVNLEVQQPAIAGATNAFSVSGATPMATVFYAVGLTGGETQIPGCVAGLDIAAPLIFATASASANGDAVITVPVPAFLSQVPLLLQVYDYAGCATSNVKAVSFL